MADIEDLIATGYAGLSTKLRAAADYVLANPVEVATRSLRSVAEDSRLAPATFTRLAQALGFTGYEQLREMQRRTVGQRYVGFSEKARAIQSETAEGAGRFLTRHCTAVAGNLAELEHEIGPARLERLADLLAGARQVLVAGSLSSRGLTQHLVYLAGYFATNWRLVGREGASGAAVLAEAGPGDVLLILTLRPFASRSIRLAQVAHSQGLKVIVVTDSHTCPALADASDHVIVPTDSPQFFSSNAAVLALLEALIGVLVGKMGDSAQEKIAAVAELNHALEEYWPEN